jgi:hypothetical protein
MRWTWLAVIGLSLGVVATARAQNAERQRGDAGDATTDGAPPRENTPRACQNGGDDDGDGRVDCEDPDCARLIFCVGYRPPERTPERCANGVDDDGDGRADCDDPECVEVLASCAPPPSEERALGTEGIYAPRVVEEGPELRYLPVRDRRRYPQAHVEQPLTYLSGMLVPALGVSVRDFPAAGRSIVHGGLGLTYGILDDWQVTLLPVAIRFAPTVEYESPAISSTLRFFAHEVIELGVYANVAIPVVSNRLETEPLPLAHLVAMSRGSDVAQLDLALLARLHLGEVARLDLSPAATLIFTQPEVRVDLSFPLALAFQITPFAYLGAESGLVLPGTRYDEPKVPLGFFVGTTIPGSRRGPVLDARVRFGWPTFWDAARIGDEVRADGWQITLDVRVFTYLLP